MDDRPGGLFGLPDWFADGIVPVPWHSCEHCWTARSLVLLMRARPGGLMRDEVIQTEKDYKKEVFNGVDPVEQGPRSGSTASW
jgi:hypothetical protein